MRDKALHYFAAGGITLITAFALSSCGNNPDDIIVSSETAIDSRFSSANSELAQAQGYESAGKTRKALSTYADVSKQYPFSTAAAEASFSQARILDARGNLFDAFEAYQTLITQHPNSKYYARSIKRQEEIAHSVADGIIKNNFLGLKTKISPSKTIGMLADVRNNAPSAPSASRAQFATGRIMQQNKDYSKAISAYQQMAVNYPSSKEAPEALFQIGEILVLKSNEGNQNRTNVNRASEAYTNLIERYPRHPRAKDARNRIATLGEQGVQRNYDTAEFYRKKGQTTSAIFYYNEVIRETKSGQLHDLARQKITELGG